jgi:hypothetical protein
MIEDRVKQNSKGSQIASFLILHFLLSPMCGSILHLGLQQLFFVVVEVAFN